MENTTQPENIPVPPLPQTPPITPQNNTKKKLSLLLGLVVFVTGAVLMGMLTLHNKKTEQQPADQQPTITPTHVAVSPTATPVVPTTTPTVVTPEPAFKTYTNTKYNYQLKYPDTWSVQATNVEGQIEKAGVINIRMTSDETPAESGFSIFVIPNPKNLSLVDWVKQNPDNGTLLPADKVTSSVIEFYKFGWTKIDDNSIGYVPTGYVKYGIARIGNLYYVVVYSADLAAVEQIMSTFQFMDVFGTPTL